MAGKSDEGSLQQAGKERPARRPGSYMVDWGDR